MAGLPQVPSLLSIMWLTIFLPILCKSKINLKSMKGLANCRIKVAEVIALKLRRPGASNEYLYLQIFAGLSSVLASACLLELWRYRRGGLFKQESRRND